MLAPIEIEGKRYWIEFSVIYDVYEDPTDYTALRNYILDNASIKGVYCDEEIGPELRRTVASLLKSGYDSKQIVEDVKELYGIPEVHVNEVMDDLMLQVKQEN